MGMFSWIFTVGPVYPQGTLSEGDRRSERTKRYATEARSGSHWGASRSWVRQETDCPLGLSGGTSPSHPLTSGRSFTSDPHKCEVINWCCCKPLSLWWVTKSVVICIHHRFSGLKQHSLISLGVLLPCGLTDQTFSESSTEQQGSANQPATSRVPFLLGLLLLSQCRALPWKAASSGEFQKSQGPIPPAQSQLTVPLFACTRELQPTKHTCRFDGCFPWAVLSFLLKASGQYMWLFLLTGPSAVLLACPPLSS